MRSLTLASRAKINLYLRVLGKRADGYHDVVTLFHRLSLKDTLRLTKKSGGKFFLECSDPSLSLGEGNLIRRAYRLLQKKFPKLGGVSVFLQKNIPIAAGLGGGSSNAAAFFLGMKRLYGLRVSKRELMRLGGELGADVPFFLSGERQAVGLERGDRLLPCTDRRRLWFILIVSKKGLATKKVYAHLPRRNKRAVSLTNEIRAVKLIYNFLREKDFRRVSTLLRNDLELAAFRLRPSLRKIIGEFGRLGIQTARMSGSGPTVFAILSQKQEAERLAQKLRIDSDSQRILICHSE